MKLNIAMLQRASRKSAVSEISLAVHAAIVNPRGSPEPP